MCKLSHGNILKPHQNLYKSNNYIYKHTTRHAHHFHSIHYYPIFLPLDIINSGVQRVILLPTLSLH